jgi:hypothetical protein
LRKGRYQGRFWEYVGDDLHPHTVLRYTPNHSRDGPGGPVEVLKNYSGFVQADAFSGYDAIYLGSHGRIVEVACWAHARREFIETQNADRARAEIALAHIAQLYAVEKELREHGQEDWQELDRDERFDRIVAERQARSLPVLKQLGDWLEAEAPRVLPKNPFREAMEYTRNNWTALNQYPHHGYLAIDNNAAERALRGIAIGRRYAELRTRWRGYPTPRPAPRRTGSPRAGLIQYPEETHYSTNYLAPKRNHLVGATLSVALNSCPWP